MFGTKTKKYYSQSHCCSREKIILLFLFVGISSAFPTISNGIKTKGEILQQYRRLHQRSIREEEAQDQPNIKSRICMLSSLASSSDENNRNNSVGNNNDNNDSERARAEEQRNNNPSTKRSKNSKNKKTTTTNSEPEPCNVVFTHTNADFDSLAAAVALSLLWKHENPLLPTHVVLPRGVNPIVQRFMAFHKQLLPVRGFKTIQAEDVHAIGVVDAQSASRIGRGQSWLDNARSIHIFDHHDTSSSSSSPQQQKSASSASLMDIATEIVIDKVGSTTTLLVERLKEAGIQPAPHEATLFALGIRFDTGGLVYEGTTVRDAAAFLWCLENGASQVAIAEFGVAKVNQQQRMVLQSALGQTKTETFNGLRISSVMLEDNQYISGLAHVCEEILELTDSDVLILGATHGGGKKKRRKKKNNNRSTAPKAKVGNKKDGPKEETTSTQWISLIGRASNRAVGVDLNTVMQLFGGGGHPRAAAGALRCKQQLKVTDQERKENSNDDDNINDKQQRSSIIIVEEDHSSLDILTVLAKNGELSAQEVLTTAIAIVQTQIPEQIVALNCMDPNILTVNEDYTVSQARQIFDEYGLKSAPIVSSEGKFRSSIKYNDLIKASRAGRTSEKLKGMIRPSLQTVLPETTLEKLEDLLVNKNIGRIPVVDDDGIFVGMITRTDILRQHKLYGENK